MKKKINRNGVIEMECLFCDNKSTSIYVFTVEMASSNSKGFLCSQCVRSVFDKYYPMIKNKNYLFSLELKRPTPTSLSDLTGLQEGMTCVVVDYLESAIFQPMCTTNVKMLENLKTFLKTPNCKCVSYTWISDLEFPLDLHPLHSLPSIWNHRKYTLGAFDNAEECYHGFLELIHITYSSMTDWFEAPKFSG